MSDAPIVEIDHVPPVISVKTLIDGRLPPAVFLAVQKQKGSRQEIEEYVHMTILPVELQVTIRREVRFVVYQQLAKNLAEFRSLTDKDHNDEQYIIGQMENVWPTLSDEHRHRLTVDGLAHKSSEYTGEF